MQPIETKSEDNENNLKEFIKKIVAGKVIHERDDKYSIVIKLDIDQKNNDFSEIKICPLFFKTQKHEILSKKIKFINLPFQGLSKFFIVTAGDLSKVIEIPLENMPSFDERIKYVKNEILSDIESCLQYLALCCSGQYSNSYYTTQKSRTGGEQNKTISFSGLYEDILKTIAFHPEQVDSITELHNLDIVKNNKKNANELYELNSILNAVYELKTGKTK